MALVIAGWSNQWGHNKHVSEGIQKSYYGTAETRRCRATWIAEDHKTPTPQEQEHPAPSYDP